MSEIKIVKLISGNLLIGQVSEDEQLGLMIVEKPFEFMIFPGPDGRPQPRLIPYGVENGILPPIEVAKFELMYVMHIRECPQQIQDAYTHASTGIEIAKPGTSSKFELVKG